MFQLRIFLNKKTNSVLMFGNLRMNKEILFVVEK